MTRGSRAGARTPADVAEGLDARAAARVAGLVAAVFALLLFSSFSVPGRVGTQQLHTLDWIAWLKVCTRLGSLALMGYSMHVLGRYRRFRRVLRQLTPFLVFIAIGFASSLWSPMKASSFGHALEFLLYLMIAASVASVADSGDRLSPIVLALVSCYMVLASVSVFAHFFVPEIINLADGGDRGIIHPGQGGRMAVCAVALTFMGAYLWGWKWAKRLAVPVFLLQTLFLVLAMRRTPIATMLLFLACFSLLRKNRIFLWIWIHAGCAAGALYLSADPYLERPGLAAAGLMEYLMRGQSEEQLMELSGREELWTAVWNAYLQSPLIGYGYGIGSPSGTLDVWHETQFVAAHNLFLQVLVSNGLAGFVPFVWGMWRPLAASLGAARGGGPGEAGAAWLFFTVYGLFMIFGSVSSCFIVQVEPANLTFFLAYGAAVGMCGLRDGAGAAAARQGGRS